ncbi:MAG: hypothetical protein J1E98_03070 [Lachnospiraceae bacterium]|nr:hypothetical protein [Lachnospiraceae bacterium]
MRGIKGVQIRTNEKAVINILFWTIILISTFSFIIKALIVTGITMSDEAHMIATSYRFYLGDAFLVDDWSPEQLHGVVLLPLIYTYRLFSESNDGIFIFIRILYLLLKFVILVYGFARLHNKNNYRMIYAGLLLWYFFTPYNIETLTYQAAPLAFLMFALIVISTEVSICEYVLLGVFYALSILSQPFWVLSYFFILIGLIDQVYKKKINGERVVAFHIGLFVIFIMFIILLFSRASFSDIVINLPYIFYEQDHTFIDYGLWNIINDKIWKVFISFVLDYKITTLVNLIYLCILILFPMRRERLRWLVLVCLGISCFSMFSFHETFLMNKMYVPFLWTGIESLFYTKNRKYFLLLFLGFIFSLATALGTNTGDLATSASLCIYSCIVLFYFDDNFDNNWHKWVNWVLIVCILSMVLFFRIYNTWASGVISPNDFENKILDGPLKGLYTDDNKYENYYKILIDIDELKLDKTKDILFCGTQNPIAHIYAETEYGTMGTPFSYLNYERLDEYFNLHPDKLPTAVYYTNFTEIDEESAFYKSILPDYNIIRIENRLLAKIKK